MMGFIVSIRWKIALTWAAPWYHQLISAGCLQWGIPGWLAPHLWSSEVITRQTKADLLFPKLTLDFEFNCFSPE